MKYVCVGTYAQRRDVGNILVDERGHLWLNTQENYGDHVVLEPCDYPQIGAAYAAVVAGDVREAEGDIVQGGWSITKQADWFECETLFGTH